MEIWLILPAFLPRVLQGCASGSRLGGGVRGVWGGSRERTEKSLLGALAPSRAPQYREGPANVPKMRALLC